MRITFVSCFELVVNKRNFQVLMLYFDMPEIAANLLLLLIEKNIAY